MVDEYYKLYFQGQGIRYEGRKLYFDKGWFFGPVLHNSNEIEPDNYLDLDFTKQNIDTPIFLPKSYYIAKLSWKDVIYSSEWVELTECTLEHDQVGTLRDIQEEFTILIDCKSHEHWKHHNSLLYPAWVLNREFEIIGGK